MYKKIRILIVEDELHIVNFLSARFLREGMEPVAVGSVAGALDIAKGEGCDIVILDLGLPDRDGMDFIRTIRKTDDIPIIVLSARDGETDKVEALDAGANDYITKPFGADELMARIRSTMRVAARSNYREEAPEDENFDDLTISYAARKVFVSGKEIHLTKTEYTIVELLALNAGRIMTYEEIISKVWNWIDQSSVKKLQVNMAISGASLERSLVSALIFQMSLVLVIGSEDEMSTLELIISIIGVGLAIGMAILAFWVDSGTNTEKNKNKKEDAVGGDGNAG